MLNLCLTNNNQYLGFPFSVQKYFQSGPKYKVLDEGQGRSHMTLEWTNQHGCGSGNKRQNCNIVFQYMCEETVESDKGEQFIKSKISLTLNMSIII